MCPSNQVEIPAAQFFAALDAMAPAQAEFTSSLLFTKYNGYVLPCVAPFVMEITECSQQCADNKVRAIAFAQGFSGEVAA
jgi:hypothetical protein